MIDSAATEKTMDESELEKKAVEELLKEAKLGAERASVSGPSGWQKGPQLRTNKQFLANTLVHTMHSNRIIERHKRDPRRSWRDHSGERSSKESKRLFLSLRSRSSQGDESRGKKDKADRNGDHSRSRRKAKKRSRSGSVSAEDRKKRKHKSKRSERRS